MNTEEEILCNFEDAVEVLSPLSYDEIKGLFRRYSLQGFVEVYVRPDGSLSRVSKATSRKNPMQHCVAQLLSKVFQ
jgi:hypothetical protein